MWRTEFFLADGYFPQALEAEAKRLHGHYRASVETRKRAQLLNCPDDDARFFCMLNLMAQLYTTCKLSDIRVKGSGSSGSSATGPGGTHPHKPQSRLSGLGVSIATSLESLMLKRSDRKGLAAGGRGLGKPKGSHGGGGWQCCGAWVWRCLSVAPPPPPQCLWDPHNAHVILLLVHNHRLRFTRITTRITQSDDTPPLYCTHREPHIGRHEQQRTQQEQS